MTYRTDVELQDSLILPIVKSKKIGEGGSATIYEIEILPEYNHLFCSHSCQTTDRTEACCTKTNTFALKTYNVNSHRASDYYDTEVNAFKLFRNTRDVNMIGFHGSFKQGGRFNLILEYANEKSLEDYFQNTSPPQDGHDIIQFWESLCKVIFSINILHTQLCKPSSSKSQRINGWHQDVKPANILLSSVNAETNDRIASPYAWNFKLADMGISHFKPSEDGNTDQDSQGTKTYGAPECHRGDDVSRKNKIFVTPAVDIWSLAAVFSEAAAWLVGGFDNVKIYRNNRKEATSSIPGLGGTDCFHDGENVLEGVGECHEKLNKHSRRCDVITSEILSMVEGMLQGRHDKRPTAMECWKKSQSIIAIARQNLDSDKRPNAHVEVHEQTRLPLPPSSPPHRGDSQGNINNFQARRGPRDNCLNRNTIDGGSMGKEVVPVRSGHHREYPHSISMIEGHGGASQYNGGNSRQTHRNTTKAPPSPIVDVVQGKMLPTRPVSDFEEKDYGGQPSSAGSSSDGRESGLAPFPNSNQIQQSGFPATSGRPQPYKTVQDLLRWKEKRKAELKLPFSSRQAKQARMIESRKDLGNEGLFDSLSGRDHVFVIDQSLSMNSYWDSEGTASYGVAKVFEALSYLVKEADDDGIDLYFTGDITGYHKKHTSSLVEIVSKRPRQGESDMYMTLQRILNGYRSKLHKNQDQQPVSVYILTDGVWQTNTDLRPLITSFDSFLAGGYRDGLQLGIQFIRFGDDRKGIERLQKLDNMSNVKFDFVDTTAADGNIWKMLLGATNRDFDASEDIPSRPSTNRR